MKLKFSNILYVILTLCILGALFACQPQEESKPSYMVTFSRNITDVTVTDMPSPQNITEGGYVTEPTKNPVTSLYHFIGWFEDEQMTVPFNFSTTVVTGRITIYAGWELKVTRYQVSFDLNYAGAPNPTEQQIISGNQVVEPETPDREGYRFIAWSTDPVAEYLFDFSNPISSDIDLYAIWKAEYALTYEFNLSGTSQVSEIYLESENTVRPTDPTRLNFSFGGWFRDQAFTIPFSHGSTLSSDAIIYARWIRTSYDVTFDLNYQGSTPLIVRVNVNVDVPTPAIPTRSGYVFDQWYTSATVQTDETLFGFGKVTSDNVVVYAGWKAIYQITLQLNYEGAENPSIINVIQGNELDVNSPVRENYVFHGWYLDQATTIEYTYGPVLSNQILYAKWTEATISDQEYTITFDLNYQDSTPVTQIVLENGIAIRPVDPIRPGYQFSGWVVSPSSSTTYRFTPVTGDVTVYARWISVWQISFNLDYPGAPQPEIIEALDGSRISRPETPSREGLWQFVTWNDSEGLPFIFTSIIQKNHDLYAVWTRSGYSITWNFNYTEAPAPAVTDVLLGTLIREPQKPNRIGNWAISGWYLDQALTQEFSLNSELTQDITLYAKWATGFSYRVSLNYVGAPTSPVVILQQGSNIPAKPANPVRANFTFVGWSTTTNGNPDFNGFGLPIQADLTVYAQWRHTYIFEAEYVSLAGKNGAGWSGGAAGTAMIVKDTITDDPALGTNANASNGYFLSYLYSNGLFIDFEITSDRTTEATLILRLSAEQRDPFSVTDDEYQVSVNGLKVNYGTLTIQGALAALMQQKLPFEDVLTITITLQEGVNIIRFTTNNQISMGGTMDATAPLFDCIKIDTIAQLTWNPVLENLNVFN
jgi:uncharacterized repeat protein (TIGR02543 family)